MVVMVVKVEVLEHDGIDSYIDVPLGTIIRDADTNEILI